MSEKDIVKKYVTDDLTIIWRPQKCIHAGVCIMKLPQVYKPDSRPWIKPERASTSELKEQIDACPSGALSYELKINKSSTESSTEISTNKTRVSVLAEGPLVVEGLLEIKNANGEYKIQEGKTAFCRCGYSHNKPFCDGSHLNAKFDQ